LAPARVLWQTPLKKVSVFLSVNTCIMQLKMIWNSTNDSIVFDVINKEVAQWFVATSNQFGNKYSVGTQIVDILNNPQSTDTLIEQEIAYINTVNQALKKYRIPIEFDIPSNWYSQQQLNSLHKSWAQSRFKIPKLGEFLYKIDPTLHEAYQEMNCHIHFIENSFCYDFRDANNWRQANPFCNQTFDWHVCHLQIMYPGHGREAFEKFQVQDDKDDWEIDNVNWTNIDGFFKLNLSTRPYQTSPPQEFLDWCQQKGLTPCQPGLALANVHNWQDNLDNARQTVAKNVKIKDNYFALELI
jgi:hypothetical protein